MSLHEVLGVAENASPDEIKKAYRRKAQKCHPDVGGDKEEFKQLTVAYEVLSDEDKRRRYEETGNADTESARSFVHVAVEFFNRALQKALQDDPVYLDIVGMALKEVSEIERDLLSQIMQTEVDKGKLVKVLKRLKRKCRKKKGEEDVLKSSVEALKTELERRTVMLESKLDTLQQAKEYLQRYEYNYEQRSNGWPDNCTDGFGTFHFKLG